MSESEKIIYSMVGVSKFHNKKPILKDKNIITEELRNLGNWSRNEKIVLVATFAQHRNDSFEACNFIMDFLKNDAPFWKKEFYNDSYEWLENTKVKN